MHIVNRPELIISKFDMFKIASWALTQVYPSIFHLLENLNFYQIPPIIKQASLLVYFVSPFDPTGPVACSFIRFAVKCYKWRYVISDVGHFDSV